MAYKRLLTDISIRIILLVCTLLVLVYFWAGNRDPLILLNLLLLVILQVYLFIRSQNRVNRKLRLFLEALKFDDLGLAVREDFKDSSFRKLHETMKGIMEKSRQMNLENQQQMNYFKAVTEHAGVGILAFDENLEIRLVNHTCMDLLGIRELSSLGDLEKVKEGLPGQLKEMRAGQQKLLRISLQNPADITGETQMQLSVRAAEIKLEEERVRLLTFQNIQEELAANEVEAWQRVIRVLTHEITNSTGPIASSAQTLLEMLEKDTSLGKHSEEMFSLKEDLLEGLRIIRERSMGMEEFVKQFRKVTLIPEPKIEKIPMGDLFQGIKVLFEKRMKEKGIAFERSIEPPDLVLYADRNLVEQALINLMNNALEAMESTPVRSLRLDAREAPRRQCIISLTDSGKGIPEEDLDKIFIPFYTSREGGSGIGLSLVRNIMRMHRGSIQVSSDPGVRTSFRLIF